MFFEKLLKGSDTSVISGTMDNLRKAQSMDNLDAKISTEKVIGEDRPRSASPNLNLALEKVNIDDTDDQEADSPEIQGKIKSSENQGEQKKEEETNNSENTNIEQPGNSGDSNKNDQVQNEDTVKKVKLVKRVSSDSKRTHFSKENLNLNLDESTISVDDRTDGVPESPASSKCRPFVDIPEFNWSMAHQRLLTELLFSIEKDIQVWKT